MGFIYMRMIRLSPFIISFQNGWWEAHQSNQGGGSPMAVMFSLWAISSKLLPFPFPARTAICRLKISRRGRVLFFWGGEGGYTSDCRRQTSPPPSRFTLSAMLKTQPPLLILYSKNYDSHRNSIPVCASIEQCDDELL